MPRILLASDAPWVRTEIRADLMAPGTEVLEVERGSDVLPVVRDHKPDAVILDFQIGNMGACAVCRELREEEGSGRVQRTPVVVLLDRAADAFLAKRVDADAWIPKPIPPRALERTLEILLEGGAWTPEVGGIRKRLDDEVAGTTVQESESRAFQASPTSPPNPA